MDNLETPLHWAAKNLNADLINLLIINDADPTI